jgi:hydroxymethylpyrimidine pyrophosphatase-like HAD family hydrolase
VLILTASGNNRDTLATYQAAVEREPRGIFVICFNSNSKVERLAGDRERTIVFSQPLPTGRDGYLATNSLAAMSAVIIRAFGESPIPAGQVLAKSSAQFPKELANATGESDFYLALFGGWGRPAAIDLESKFSEAGLGGVMLADYRNFAHGRHNWIDKRGSHTTVVSFITPESAALAKKTLALLPTSTRIIKLATELEGSVGALALLMDVFRLTMYVGQLVGIDPGRPGVPDYGSRIYRLGPTPCGQLRSLQETKSPVERKLSARGTISNVSDREIVIRAQRVFVASMRGARFGSVVLDFDGTVLPPGAHSGTKIKPAIVSFFQKLLRKGIPLYFATGRGDSIHPIIAQSLHPRLHSRVFLSYYNGAVTRCLTEDPPKSEGGLRHTDFETLLAQIKTDPFIAGIANPENKSFQLTLKATNISEFRAVSVALRELVARQPTLRMRVVQSSHSVDVIPEESSKLNCVMLAQSRLPAGNEVLTIGDCGAIFGNDYELLTHPFSLSVDTVSADLRSCWNLLPRGCRNVAGLVSYAGWFRISSGSFTLSIPRNVC